jgi:HAD superfamily hydrolase (TIGR01549 family)
MQALIFDLDGTLIDTVYAHVLAWQKTLTEGGIRVNAWRIHRRIGMSGGLFVRALTREIGREIGPDEANALQRRHSELFAEYLPEREPLPGAVDLLKALRKGNVPFGIATSGRRPDIDKSLEALELPDDVVVIERHDVAKAKPDPDLFLACRAKMNVSANEWFVVGDAVWDLMAARRAGMLGVGVLSGGYGEDELSRAGAFRVYRDAADLHRSLDDLGVRL